MKLQLGLGLGLFLLKGKHWFIKGRLWGHITGGGPRKTMAGAGHSEMHPSSERGTRVTSIPKP